MRIGFGYDIHRLVKGRNLMIGCFHVPCHTGEEAYSDGDVLVHAMIDALFGAAAIGDIGSHFPSTDPQWKDAPGSRLLKTALDMVREKGYVCRQADTVVILQKPRLRPYIDTIRSHLAEIMIDTPFECISVKVKTKEGCGEVGAGRAVEAYAVTLLEEA